MTSKQRRRSASTRPAVAAPAPKSADDGRTMRLVKQASLVVGLLSGAVGLIFVLVPAIRPTQSEPPAHQAITISGLSLAPHTTQGQFLDYADRSKLGFTRKQLSIVGASVFARVEVAGFRGKTLTIERQLIDADGNVSGQARAFKLKPSADQVTYRWPDWVQLPDRVGSFAIVIKVLDKDGISAIACGESTPFAGLAGKASSDPPRVCEGGS
jgi:hypothetical protein